MKKFNKSLFAISFSQGFIPPNIPIATFKQGDKELNFILDTGSDNNVIDSNVLPQIEHDLDQSQQISLAGLGGAQTVSACRIKFQYEEENFTETFLVSDLQDAFTLIRKCHAIPIHGMLGSKFLKDNDLTLDFHNLIAYNNKK